MSVINNNGYKFLRGQMYWWNDPICKQKASNVSSPFGEETVRHSRPVILIQDHTCIENGSVLVIPCSSSTHNKHDIAITDPEIQKQYSVTYLRVDKIMPVNVNTLSRYMLTLNDEIMRKIEKKISKILFPNLNYDWNKNDNIYKDDLGRRHVKSNVLISTKLYSKDIIDDVPDSKWTKSKIKQFCEDFVNIPLWQVSEIYDISESTCIKYFRNWRDYCKDQEIINYNRSVKWSPEQRISFIKFYYVNGIKATEEEYGLSRNTIKKYISKFKERHPNVEKIDEVKITELPFPDTKNAANNIMWFANIVAKTCKAFDMYHSVYLNYKGKNTNLNSEGFYTILRDCINEGILRKLGIIKMNDNSLYVPEILGSDKYINSWKFLDICKDDLIPPTSSDGVNLMRSCRKRYGNNICMHIDIISEIRIYLNNNIAILPAGLKIFESTLRDIYCDPDVVKLMKK